MFQLLVKQQQQQQQSGGGPLVPSVPSHGFGSDSAPRGFHQQHFFASGNHFGQLKHDPPSDGSSSGYGSPDSVSLEDR